MDIYKMKMISGDDQSKKRLSMEAKPGRNLLSSLSSILQHHHQYYTHDVRIKYIVLKCGFFVGDRECSILYRAQLGKIEMFFSLNGNRAVPWLSEQNADSGRMI